MLRYAIMHLEMGPADVRGWSSETEKPLAKTDMNEASCMCVVCVCPLLTKLYVCREEPGLVQ
jgi:hypothetical protein